MRLVLPILLLLLGLGGGVGAGLFLGGSTDAGTEASTAQDEHDDGHDGDDLAGDDGHSDDHTEDGAATGATEFVRLNNQFVVPVVQDGAVRSLVVMALTLEVDTGENTFVFDREPRLRDAFLQAMFAHANVGGFNGQFTEAAALAPLRQALSEAATGILGDIVYDVLIVDITRQDA